MNVRLLYMLPKHLFYIVTLLYCLDWNTSVPHQCVWPHPHFAGLCDLVPGCPPFVLFSVSRNFHPGMSPWLLRCCIIGVVEVCGCDKFWICEGWFPIIIFPFILKVLFLKTSRTRKVPWFGLEILDIFLGFHKQLKNYLWPIKDGLLFSRSHTHYPDSQCAILLVLFFPSLLIPYPILSHPC